MCWALSVASGVFGNAGHDPEAEDKKGYRGIFQKVLLRVRQIMPANGARRDIIAEPRRNPKPRRRNFYRIRHGWWALSVDLVEIACRVELTIINGD